MNRLPSALVSFLSRMDRVAVCFSGGIDSTLLLAASRKVLGNRVLALTACSATFTDEEAAVSVQICRDLAIPHLLLDTHELEDPLFTANTADRCYHCKKHRLSVLISAAASRGFDRIADGENLDDAADFRPGRRAADEHGVCHPLVESGLTKGEIRRISREMGLPNWNQPSNACLASRIPYGQTITRKDLERVRICESFLRQFRISPVIRVRHRGSAAWIQVAPADVIRLSDPDLMNPIEKFFLETGFQSVAIDPCGYHSEGHPAESFPAPKGTEP